MSKKRVESPLQILARRHNFRVGRLLGFRRQGALLDDHLRNQFEELVGLQIAREQYRYESRCMAIKSGDPANASAFDEELNHVLHEIDVNGWLAKQETTHD